MLSRGALIPGIPGIRGIIGPTKGIPGGNPAPPTAAEAIEGAPESGGGGTEGGATVDTPDPGGGAPTDAALAVSCGIALTAASKEAALKAGFRWRCAGGAFTGIKSAKTSSTDWIVFC